MRRTRTDHPRWDRCASGTASSPDPDGNVENRQQPDAEPSTTRCSDPAGPDSRRTVPVPGERVLRTRSKDRSGLSETSSRNRTIRFRVQLPPRSSLSRQSPTKSLFRNGLWRFPMSGECCGLDLAEWQLPHDGVSNATLSSYVARRTRNQLASPYSETCPFDTASMLQMASTGSKARFQPSAIRRRRTVAHATRLLPSAKAWDGLP